MFCTKCGKQIDYNSTVCNECVRAENSFFDASQQYNTYPQPPIVEPTPEKPKGSRMVGFGGALAAMIIGDLAIVFAIMSIAYLMTDVIVSYALFYVFIVGAFVMSIFSLVLGIRAIRVFVRSSPKPIATLVLGIGGILGTVATYMVFIYIAFISLVIFLLGASLAGML